MDTIPTTDRSPVKMAASDWGQPGAPQGGAGWGGQAPQGGGGGYAPPPGGMPPAEEPAKGFMIACIITMALGGMMFLAGLFPCLGWLNWFGAPFNLVPLALGIIAMVAGPKGPDGKTAYIGIYIASIIIGALGLIGGSVRCLLGGGLV